MWLNFFKTRYTFSMWRIILKYHSIGSDEGLHTYYTCHVFVMKIDMTEI